MKQCLVILFLCLSFNNSWANCPRTAEQFICPGDAVISFDAWEGIVQAVNYRTQMATVDWRVTNRGDYINQRAEAPLRNLGLRQGCIYQFCVGDPVVSLEGWRGVITGVNPHAIRLGVHWRTDNSLNFISFRKMSSITMLSLGRGCVEGYCVGDLVANDEGWVGIVEAVNTFLNRVGVRWQQDETRYPIRWRTTEAIQSLILRQNDEIPSNMSQRILDGSYDHARNSAPFPFFEYRPN